MKLKNLADLPTSTLATMVATAHSTFLATGLAGKLMLILCIFSFSLSAETTNSIQLSEITVYFAPNNQGAYALVKGQVLMYAKPIFTDSTNTQIWISGETIFTMQFDTRCQDCKADVIRYKANSNSEWRNWIISDNGKSWGEITAKSVQIESEDSPAFPYSQKFICKSMAVGEGDDYLNTTKGNPLKEKLQIVFRGDENFTIQNDDGENNLYWTSENCDVLTIDGKIVNITFFNGQNGWTKYFGK